MRPEMDITVACVLRLPSLHLPLPHPQVPAHTPPPFAALMRACWAPVPDQRPDFGQIVEELEAWAQQLDAVPQPVGAPQEAVAANPGMGAAAQPERCSSV